jgi:hypothetical protein
MKQRKRLEVKKQRKRRNKKLVVIKQQIGREKERR